MFASTSAARMKLVGGDSGRVEHEEFVSGVILAPSERAVVDVLFGQPGPLELQHRTPDRTYRLAERGNPCRVGRGSVSDRGGWQKKAIWIPILRACRVRIRPTGGAARLAAVAGRRRVRRCGEGTLR
jgi:hypothetical protein